MARRIQGASYGRRIMTVLGYAREANPGIPVADLYKMLRPACADIWRATLSQCRRFHYSGPVTDRVAIEERSMAEIINNYLKKEELNRIGRTEDGCLIWQKKKSTTSG